MTDGHSVDHDGRATRNEIRPPAALLAFMTGDEWPARAADIPRLIAMSEHGTLSEDYIASRNDPQKAYNARPEYVAQFVLK